MFFSLLFYEFSCTYQYQNNLGAELFSQEMNEGEKLCINISYYPSFVVFDDFEKDTLFSIFTHSPLADSPQSVKSTYIRYLNNYVPILDPFVQIVFESESPVNLSFTLLSLPGMCNDGIYFTTKTNENYILSTEESGFNKISPFHDKCIFKSVTDETNVTMSYSTDSHWSQAFVYESYDRYYSIGNNETHAFSTTDPYFYRIIVGEHSYYNQLSISFESPDDSQGGGYPLIFLEDQIDPILKSWDKPTQELFNVISVMSVMSLRENCFDSTTENALSAICAASVMQALFTDFDPEQLNIKFPP